MTGNRNTIFYHPWKGRAPKPEEEDEDEGSFC
jgi:hypothetical protein